jgi:hypothetical protein
MPNTVPASAPALPNAMLIPFPRSAEERFEPIFIKPASAIVGEAEHKALRVAVRLLAMDHDALVAMASAHDPEAQQAVRWMALSYDLAASVAASLDSHYRNWGAALARIGAAVSCAGGA